MSADLSEFRGWFAAQARRQYQRVTPVPLEDTHGWRIDPVTGSIHHRSGRFFSVQGLHVDTDARDPGEWSQPIIVQPEIGILGVLARIRRGRVQFLMQAKTEPGNVNGLQLSPTVQATRSNYERVHEGRPTPYLSYFRPPRRGRWVYDALQSEQGSWFLTKRNRNVIVEIDDDPPVHEGYRWTGEDELAALLQEPNLVNMDARTVLSGLPLLLARGPVPDPASERPRHSLSWVLSWFTEAKTRYRMSRRPVPLAGMRDWSMTDGVIAHRDGTHFRIIGVEVEAHGREIGHWHQPLFEPCGRGVIGFLARRFDGVLHVLVRAEVEAGTPDIVEIGPTVSCIPDTYTGALAGARPRYLDDVLGADPVRVLVDVVQSEEGGRFHHAQSRYVVVDVGDDTDLPDDEEFCWMTPGQLTTLIRYGNHVNVAARCLLSCLHGLRTSPAPA